LAAGNVPLSMSSCSFADSGCTIHFFKNKDVFTSYRPLTKVEGQSSKEGANFKILIVSRCSTRPRHHSKSTFHQQNGCSWLERYVWRRESSFLIHGSFTTSIPTALTARSLKSPTNVETWHRRLGHFGIDRIREASKLVDGLEIVKAESVGQCEDCILANLKRRAFDDDAVSETVTLRLTNIDIWGPSRVASSS